MQFKFHRQLLTLAIGTVISAVVSVGAAQAGPTGAYTNLVIFGDSLSDTGNVLSLTTAFTPQPFPIYPGAQGRFSNGPSWVEYLAAGLGLPNNAKPANLLLTGPTTVSPIGAQGGQNFAFGGARTTLGGSAGATTGLFGQLAAWNGTGFTTSLSRAADPDALYVVVAGGNDLRDARSNPALDDAGREAAAQAAAANVINAMALLAQAGARHFLISNLPDLGKTPEANSATGVLANWPTKSSEVTLDFNAALGFGAGQLDAQFLGLFGIDLDIHAMDLYGLSEAIYDDAVNNGGGKYGITNVTTPCLAPGQFSGQYYFPDAIATNCGGSAYSDPLHPSAALHALIGQLALNAVPEPASLALLAFALFSLALVRRRQIG